MEPDPIVEEIHRVREAIAARFNNDLGALCEDARVKAEQAAKAGWAVYKPPTQPHVDQGVPEKKAS